VKFYSKYIVAASLLAAATSVRTAIAQDDVEALSGKIIHPVNPTPGLPAPTAGSTRAIRPPISYHGGPIMGTPTIYTIWYGNWNQSNGSDTPDGQQIVRDFLHGLGGSPYYQTNASYSGVSGNLIIGAEYTDTGSQGTSLSDAQIQTIVSTAISGGNLPLDNNGIYFVLTSSNIAETSGFCTVYCGWHTHGTISGTDIKYAFVGNSNACLSACAIQTTGPNGNAGVDGMVSVIAHETEETNTDPDLNAWFNRSGQEDADMCAWTFGHSQIQLSSGAWYNMTLPGISVPSRNYEIQRELDSNSKCYVNYVTKAQ
jgi:hypothetical protein